MESWVSSFGGEVYYKGERLPLNNPVAVLSKGIAFVSEDRRGVGLLLDEPIDLNIVFTAIQIQGRFIRNLLGGSLNGAMTKRFPGLPENMWNRFR
jgi:simple sugar transport system ATP-binding protein